MCPKYVLLEVSRKPFLEHFLQMFSELSTQKNGKHVYQVIQPIFWSLSLGGHQQPFQVVTFSPSPKKGDIMNHLVLRLFFCSFSHGNPNDLFPTTAKQWPNLPCKASMVKASNVTERLWQRYYPFILDPPLPSMSKVTWNPNGAPCFDGKGPCFWGGLTFKNRGHLGSRYIEYICFVVHL